VDQAQGALKTPVKVFVCPTRRPLTVTLYTNTNFPSQAVYATVKGKSFTVFMSDYAGCNGTGTKDVNNNLIQDGMIRSQAGGRNTVRNSDVTDGLSYTLLLGEKAANPANPSGSTILNEDDMGYAAAFGGTNFNTVRFASASLLPLRDFQVTGPTGGAFGSNHPGTWNALMADGSVPTLNYTIDSNVFTALGTIKGRELIGDMDFGQ
jgi:hypothetical protein